MSEFPGNHSRIICHRGIEEKAGRVAAIIKRNNRYCVVYKYINEKGEKKQKCETFATMPEAKARQKEIEYRESIGTFVVPKCKTMKELMTEYISL